MSNGLGQLPNAPLVYVLAQLVFTRVPNMGQHWEDFHQSIFNKYPNSKIEDIKKLSLSESEASVETGVETRWHILDQDQQQGIILSSGALIFHTTKYITSKEFFANLGDIVEALVNVLPASNIHVHRLGLRYIDLLVPYAETPVDQQVNEKLGMLDLSEISCTPVRLERIANYKTKIGGELVFRYRQTAGTDVMPSDLFPNGLILPELMQRPKPEGVVGLLDYDHYIQDEFPLETKNIVKKFRSLHEVTSAAFRATTTNDAMKVWKE